MAKFVLLVSRYFTLWIQILNYRNVKKNRRKNNVFKPVGIIKSTVWQFLDDSMTFDYNSHQNDDDIRFKKNTS